MSDDSAKLDAQAASNALHAWDGHSSNLESVYAAKAQRIKDVIGTGSWIGTGDAAEAFKANFKLSDVTQFLAPEAKYSAKGDNSTGGAIVGALRALGQNTKTAMETTQGGNEQQGDVMRTAQRQASVGTTAQAPSGPGSTPTTKPPTGGATPPTGGTTPPPSGGITGTGEVSTGSGQPTDPRGGSHGHGKENTLWHTAPVLPMSPGDIRRRDAAQRASRSPHDREHVPTTTHTGDPIRPIREQLPNGRPTGEPVRPIDQQVPTTTHTGQTIRPIDQQPAVQPVDQQVPTTTHTGQTIRPIDQQPAVQPVDQQVPTTTHTGQTIRPIDQQPPGQPVDQQVPTTTHTGQTIHAERVPTTHHTGHAPTTHHAGQSVHEHQPTAHHTGQPIQPVDDHHPTAHNTGETIHAINDEQPIEPGDAT